VIEEEEEEEGTVILAKMILQNRQGLCCSRECADGQHETQIKWEKVSND
jgi:hypothetical protein